MQPFSLNSRLLASTALLTMIATMGSATRGQEKANPIADQVKAAVKEPTKPFTMIVQFQAKEGVQAKFEAAFAKAVKATRQEKGCLAYDLNRDTKTPTQYLLYERWQNLAALEAHLKTPHITTLLQELGDLLTAPPEVRVMLPAGD